MFNKNKILAMAMALPLIFSCTKDDPFKRAITTEQTNNIPATREPDKEVRRVLLLYSCGFNSLSSSLKEDIEELISGKIPTSDRTEDIILVYGHHVDHTYSSPTEPVLFRIYDDGNGVIRDTVKTWNAGCVSASSATLKEVLNYVHDNFLAREYNMVFSSHSTGWLPAGYYTSSSSGIDYITSSVPGAVAPLHRQGYEGPFNYEEKDLLPGEPLTKTIGETCFGTKGSYKVYNMGLDFFAEAIPMKLHTLVFDSCLMGCAEVASALKDKCDYIVFSPTEVLSDGIDYTTLFAHMFADTETDPVSVAADYFELYEQRTGVNRSATISVVDCSKVRNLEECVATIMDTYNSEFNALKGSNVQHYYRYSYNYFFDLRDAVAKAGVDSASLDALDSALDECVIYKRATESFLAGYGGFSIDTYCGLSCFLPGAVSDSVLKSAYTETEWNKSTGVIR